MSTATIPYDVAYAAHAGTSFVPEDRAKSEQADFTATLREDREQFEPTAAKSDELRQLLDEQFARYADGYRKRYIAYLQARSRCLSPMITGPSNFPTRRNEKRNNTADRRREELIEYRARALRAIGRMMHPERRPIMSGDDDATTRLREKIAKAEKSQEWYKAINAAIRKHKKGGEAAQVEALVEIGLSDGAAREMLKPDFCGRVGVPSYELSNNNANIRRMRQRLEGIERAQATPTTEQEGANGVTLEDCPAENRIRLYFPGKPSAEVRSKLKSSGFRWAPSLGCWQAYRNTRSQETAKQFVA